MKSVFIIFAVITGSLSLIASIGQLLVKNRRFENYNLFVLFFLLAFLQGQGAILFSGTVLSYPIMYFLNITVFYVLGVILYFAYFLVSLQGESLPGKKFLFFIPSLVAFIFDLYYLSLPETEKTVVMKGLFWGLLTDKSQFFKVALAGAGIQATVLMGYLVVKIRRRVLAGKNIVLPWATLFYTVMSMITINLVVTGYIFSTVDFIFIASVFLGLLIIGAFLVSYRYPEFLQIIIIPGTKNRYSRSRLTGVDLEDLHRRFLFLIDTEKIYNDENISLTDCADELEVTAHQLSEFLNEKLNCNFYTFINQYRIKEAVRLLIEEPDMTILSIAHIVGFNSKSSFYDSFSRFIGMTPVQYRNMHKKIK